MKEQVNENDTVILVLFEYTGELQWQSSQDCICWTDLECANSDSLLIVVKEHLYFRAKVTVGICDPFYSDVAYIENAWDIDNDSDGFTENQGDCNDTIPEISPGTLEIPNNEVDENCDGRVLIIDEDSDGYNSDEDCDDLDSLINPGAIETPNNEVDEDCDGKVLIIDEDSDGYNSDEDCDDLDSLINPGALEIPNNEVDEDCDGIALIIDEDSDGYNSYEDCDDLDSLINPGAIEIPNNEVDEDCDGRVLIIDEDSDGYNSDEDCDDLDSLINPGAIEIPNNEVDEDCDGIALIIDDDSDGYNSYEDCDDLDSLINPGALEIPNNEVDEDCDGIALIIDEDYDGYNSDEDCDDLDSQINPGALDIPNNEVDEDCDGIALIIDEDYDGYNSDEDCDDLDSLINPGAMEIPYNNVDDNCDGTVDWEGKVMTVHGLIPSDSMGITLPHEHLLIVHKGDDRDLTDETTAISELQYYVDAGGKTLTEATNIGIGRNPEGLKRISTATGVNVIMGSGFYKDNWIPDSIKNRSVEQLTDIIISDIKDGINGIHAGVIGEIGISRPITQFEEKALQASARAQIATGAAVNLHFDGILATMDQIHYALDILENEGADLTRVYISHRTPYVELVDNHITYAQRGCYVAFDMLGMEIYPPVGLAYDDRLQPAETVKALIDRGYIEYILLSQDVCFTAQYVENGGYGYAHILNNIVPQMKAIGITDDQINTIMVENPKRLLPFKIYAD
ncbi:MAG: MopE-related protein [Bacteroidota bacterium]